MCAFAHPTIFPFLRHNQVLPFVHPRRLARTDHGRAVELLEDRGSHNRQADIEPLALIDLAVELLAIEAHAPHLPLRIAERGADGLELRHLDGRYETNAARAIGNDLDRLPRRHMAEHRSVLLVEGGAELFQIWVLQRLRGAGDDDLIALTGIAHVEGTLDPRYDAMDVLVAGFPAGTLSGAPKVRAMEIIDELEKDKRGLYAGSVGYFSAAGELDSCIVLRTALIKDGTMYVQAGAGIVADSNPKSEQQECVDKAKALFRAAEEAKRFASSARRGQ